MEFRQRLADFYEARQPLIDLKTKGNDPYSNPWGIDELRRKSESYLPALGRARDRVAQLMVEATDIANGYNQPTELRILPPPLIGGYSHTFNIFEAAIAFDLPLTSSCRPSRSSIR